jgi:cytochrome c-type biogenesis protein CcmH/NrfG
VSNVASLENQAIEFAKRGDFGTAARSVNEELTRAQPANQGAWTRLARCCMELGLLDDATAALDAVLQLNPQNTIARNLHIEVSKRRAGPAAPVTRKRAGTARGSTSRPSTAKSSTSRSTKAGSVALGGIGRAEAARGVVHVDDRQADARAGEQA